MHDEQSKVVILDERLSSLRKLELFAKTIRLAAIA
jgi:hypothetical protein